MAAAAGLSLWVVAAPAGEAPADADEVAAWMVERARAWAEQSCGKGWVLTELLADDFHGTAPKGSRYDKPAGEPEYDPAVPYHEECVLLEADVRFFAEDVAVVYGSESGVVTLPDSTKERRCLAWTDTWLKRDGKWQIVAAHDTRVECPPGD